MNAAKALDLAQLKRGAEECQRDHEGFCECYGYATVLPLIKEIEHLRRLSDRWKRNALEWERVARKERAEHGTA